LPIYRQKTNHVVPILALPNYVKTFLRGIFEDDSKVVGNITIDLGPGSGCDRIYLKPLIQIYSAAMLNFKIDFKFETIDVKEQAIAK